MDSELLDRHVGCKSSKTKHRYVKYRANDILKVTEAIGLQANILPYTPEAEDWRNGWGTCFLPSGGFSRPASVQNF